MTFVYTFSLTDPETDKAVDNAELDQNLNPDAAPMSPRIRAHMEGVNIMVSGKDYPTALEKVKAAVEGSGMSAFTMRVIAVTEAEEMTKNFELARKAFIDYIHQKNEREKVEHEFRKQRFQNRVKSTG